MRTLTRNHRSTAPQLQPDSSTTADSRIGRDGRRRSARPRIGETSSRRASRETSPQRREELAPTNDDSTVLDSSVSEGRPSQLKRCGSLGHRQQLDTALHRRPELSDLVAWLARTDVSNRDLELYLRDLPLSLIYPIADELLRRSESWASIASQLEDEARSRVHLPDLT